MADTNDGWMTRQRSRLAAAFARTVRRAAPRRKITVEKLEGRIAPATLDWGTGYRIVLDPGHGGTYPNDAAYQSPLAPNRGTAGMRSHVTEELQTLDMAVRVQTSLKKLDSRFQTWLTRDPAQLSWDTAKLDRDAWKAESDRSNDAQDFKGDFFLSLHFNGFLDGVRGTEALVKLTGNVNSNDDFAFGNILTAYTAGAFTRGDDRGARPTDTHNFVLNDGNLGNTSSSNHPVISTLLEIENFSTSEAVDRFFNFAHLPYNDPSDTAAQNTQRDNRDHVATEIAKGILEGRRTLFPTVETAQTDPAVQRGNGLNIQWVAHANVPVGGVTLKPLDHIGLYLYQGEAPVDTSLYGAGGNGDGRLTLQRSDSFAGRQ